MSTGICPDCGKDLGQWLEFIHLNKEGEFCGEGTADAVAGYIWNVFGINLSQANIDRIASVFSKRLRESLTKMLGEIDDNPLS